MDRFRNINYPYKDQDDTFTARGLHLNMLVDEINSLDDTSPVVVGASGVLDIILGESRDIDSAFIDYKAAWPDTLAPGQLQQDQTGKLIVNNSLEHALNPELTWTREAVRSAGSSNPVLAGIDFLKIGLNLVMRVTNNSLTYTLNFSYTVKLMSYAG